MRISEITQKGWLFEDDNNNVGIISRKTTGEYVLFKNGKTNEFSTVKELNEHIGKLPRAKSKETTSVSHFIRGYPVSYANPILVENNSSGLPLFSKREESHVNLCAGYYCLNTTKGWRTVFCPKQTTLEKHQWKGPYRTPPSHK